MAKVIVVGLERSGICSSRLLAERGDTVFITELRDDSSVRAGLDSLVRDGVLERKNAELGGHSNRFIKEADLMVLSPGVRPDSAPIMMAEERKIPIISELELGYSMCSSPIIAVTGTSGKTTVTTLIGEMLKRAGVDAVICGNIGNPFSGEIKRITPDSVVVLEVSSFQLERIKEFKPDVSIILNISANHLDRHADMEEYIRAKSRIFSNQDEKGVVFLNANDKFLKRISADIKKPRVEFFQKYKRLSSRLNIANENYLASMSAASEKNVSEKIMLEVISGFKGIEHRLEYVATVKGVDFINDSKSTTVASIEWALKSLDGRLVLIMGGRYKGGDFASLDGLIRKKVDCVVAIGETSSRIKRDLSGACDVIEERSMDKAVATAFGKARKGAKVVLSPGCSSFDMFKNYEERGKIFKDLCLGI